MIPNDELRRRALTALKPILPIALLVSLCAELPSLLSQVAGVLTQGPLMSVLYSYLESDPTLYAPETLAANVLNAITPAMLAAWGGAVLAFLLTPFLNLGRLTYTLKLLRGESGEVSDVLCCAPLFFKALGLNLLIVLKELAWSLPGVAAMVAGLGIFLANPSAVTLNIMTFIYFGGMIAAMVLMFRASLHYSMAELIMADHNETGVLTAVRRSIDMMRNRKMSLLSLQVFFFGLLILSNLLQNMLEGMSPIIGMTLGMAAQLLVAVYMQTATAAFYEAYKPPYEE